ncbi:MAG TPA: TetR-like C-terminal domain-containing protein, partial [Polyangiaceae bacterium]|nr:TetR-like C-terminal domain-containing protein [Polyangiaceae bacterium]
KETLMRELCRQDFAAFAQGFIDRVATTGNPIARLARAGLVYLEFAEHYPEHYRLMFMSDTPPTPPEAGEREDPARNAYVFLHALVSELMHEQLLRAELSNVDLVAQTVWATVHGAASLEVTLAKAEQWLDFRPRSERFAAVLEICARAVARDPEAAARIVQKELAEAEARSPAARRIGKPE